MGNALRRMGVARSGGWLVSSVCGHIGPNGSRCEIRKAHIGQHAGMDRSGEWLQWGT